MKEIENVELARRNTQLVPMDLSAKEQSRAQVPRKLFMVWNLWSHGKRLSKENRKLAKQLNEWMVWHGRQNQRQAWHGQGQRQARQRPGQRQGKGKGKNKNKGKGKQHGRKGKNGFYEMEGARRQKRYTTGHVDSTPTAHHFFSYTVVAQSLLQSCCQSVQSHIDPMHLHGSSHEARCLRFAQKHTSSRNVVHLAALDDTTHGHSFPTFS